MPNRYQLQQALVSLGGDAWIEDQAGNRVYEVDGKAFAIGRTLDLLDASGALRYTLHQRVLSFRATFEIRAGDAIVATVQKALFSFPGSKYTIQRADGSELVATGDFLDHEFVVAGPDGTALTATRAWFSVHGRYGVEVADRFDDAFALAIAIAIEQLEAEEDRHAPSFGGGSPFGG